MANDEFIETFLGLTDQIKGATAPQSPSVTACIEAFETRFPIGGKWSSVPHDYFNLYQGAGVDSLAEAMQALCAGKPSSTVLVIPDEFTERVIEVPIAHIGTLLRAIVQLPCGFLLGPSTFEWVVDLRMAGSAYLSRVS